MRRSKPRICVLKQTSDALHGGFTASSDSIKSKGTDKQLVARKGQEAKRQQVLSPVHFTSFARSQSAEDRVLVCCQHPIQAGLKVASIEWGQKAQGAHAETDDRWQGCVLYKEGCQVKHCTVPPQRYAEVHICKIEARLICLGCVSTTHASRPLHCLTCIMWHGASDMLCCAAKIASRGTFDRGLAMQVLMDSIGNSANGAKNRRVEWKRDAASTMYSVSWRIACRDMPCQRITVVLSIKRIKFWKLGSVDRPFNNHSDALLLQPAQLARALMQHQALLGHTARAVQQLHRANRYIPTVSWQCDLTVLSATVYILHQSNAWWT